MFVLVCVRGMMAVLGKATRVYIDVLKKHVQLPGSIAANWSQRVC